MSILNKWFDLRRQHTTVRQEVFAGFTTFSTMAYIIVVNPLILAKAGMNFSSVMLATLLIAAVSTFLMGVVGRYPIAVAPGMGMNAYFTYSVVIGMGIPWQTALGVVFVTSIILLLLWITKLRQRIIRAIPLGLKIATTAGVGMFLVVIALNNAKMIVSNPNTLITVGNLLTPEAAFTIFGIIVITALMARGVNSAMLIGILVNWLVGLILGYVQWEGVIDWPSFSTATFGALDIQGALAKDLWMVVFAFVFICLFDSSGSLMGLAYQGGYLDKQGKLPRMQRALLPDVVGTFGGAFCGSSPAVVFVESASGIAAGGRTGLVAVTVAGMFLISLFFEPLAASIPTFAITPVLFIVGAMMIKSLKDLTFDDPSDWIPALAVFVGIPLSYSIGIGIGFGLVLYPLCKLIAGKVKEVNIIIWIIAALFFFKFVIA